MSGQWSEKRVHQLVDFDLEADAIMFVGSGIGFPEPIM
jgi:hypothetical protein